jgi:hypothetical protein
VTATTPTGQPGPADGQQRLKRLLREPTVHFFLLGALLFLLHHLFVGAPRTIAVTPGVRAEVARRFKDDKGRPPSDAELAAAVRDWKRDEALYREALRDGLDRDDATIRTVLIDKVRARAALAFPQREPTDAELREWLASHQATYQTPPRYSLEWVAFAKNQAGAAAAREKYERDLASGGDPKRLGRPLFSAEPTRDELPERFGPALAERIPTFPSGPWQRAETADELLLLRVVRVDTGAPRLEQIRPRVAADFTYAARAQAIHRAEQAIVERYRFEETR